MGVVAYVAGSLDIGSSPIDVPMVLFLATLAAVAQRMPVFLFRNSAISVAFAATIAAYVLYGTGIALWVNTVSAVVNAFTPKRKPLRKVIANVGILAISAYLASTAYQLVGGQVPPGDVLPTVVAVAVSGLVYFVVNSALVACIVALTTDASFGVVYRENYSWMPVNYVATAMSGAALALAYESLQFYGAATFVMPLGIAWYSFKLYTLRTMEVRHGNEELRRMNASLEDTKSRLEEANVSIIGALVGALEAKDPYTEGHSAATMLHAVALARKMGLSDEDVAAVQIAALFHDIGKIGIPEHILKKAGPLDDQEWVQMKDHTTIGAALLEHVPSLERVRHIVIAHHERYDGKGYPLGVAGKELPLAAQVISVADSYHAMTSTRPYRRAMSRVEAIAELRRNSWTQFNGDAVEAFIEMLEEERPALAHAASAHTHDREHDAAAAAE